MGNLCVLDGEEGGGEAGGGGGEVKGGGGEGGRADEEGDRAGEEGGRADEEGGRAGEEGGRAKDEGASGKGERVSAGEGGEEAGEGKHLRIAPQSRETDAYQDGVNEWNSPYSRPNRSKSASPYKSAGSPRKVARNTRAPLQGSSQNTLKTIDTTGKPQDTDDDVPQNLVSSQRFTSKNAPARGTRDGGIADSLRSTASDSRS